MTILDPKLVRQGAEAETRFRAWLDASRLPHIYTDQSQGSVPAHFRRQLKRPDYLVALPYVGTVAFDVKCKTTYGDVGDFVFDVYEVRRLANFDRLFRITTFFACLDPAGSSESIWFQVEDLATLVGRKTAGTIRVTATSGLAVDMERSFQEALRDAISLA
jgi:hypothetical protein